MGKFKFAATRDRDRSTKYTAGILEHEINLLGCDFFSGDNQVAFVLAVFVVDNDHHLSLAEVVDGLLYVVEAYFIVLFHK